jgi:hypothetical protein
MKKPIPTCLAALVAACLAGPALADSGVILGLGLGESNLQDYRCDDCGAPIVSVDDQDTAWMVFAGYRFNPYVAVLGGYADLGKTTASGAGGDWQDRLEADGWFAAVRGILPLPANFEAHATLGMFWWNQKVTFTGIPPGKFDGNAPMYGLGVTYRFGPKKAMGVQVDWTRFKDVGTHDPDLGHKNDIDLYTVNFVYQLGL